MSTIVVSTLLAKASGLGGGFARIVWIEVAKVAVVQFFMSMMPLKQFASRPVPRRRAVIVFVVRSPSHGRT